MLTVPYFVYKLRYDIDTETPTIPFSEPRGLVKKLKKIKKKIKNNKVRKKERKKDSSVCYTSALEKIYAVPSTKILPSPLFLCRTNMTSHICYIMICVMLQEVRFDVRTNSSTDFERQPLYIFVTRHVCCTLAYEIRRMFIVVIFAISSLFNSCIYIPKSGRSSVSDIIPCIVWNSIRACKLRSFFDFFGCCKAKHCQARLV